MSDDERGLITYAEMADVLTQLPLIVREMRRARRLSLRTAADQMGLAFTTLHRIESDGGSPDMRTTLALMRWLDTPPAEEAR